MSFQVDYDAAINFSDNSDVEDCFEPQVEVTESLEDSKIGAGQTQALRSSQEEEDELTDISNQKRSCQGLDETADCIEIHQDTEDDDDEKPLSSLATVVKSEDGQTEFQMENDDYDDDMDNDSLDGDNELEEGEIPMMDNGVDNRDDNDIGKFLLNLGFIPKRLLLFCVANDSSVDTSDEEYLPQKSVNSSPNGKRRGRPRIHPPKPRGTGRRGRPLGNVFQH